MGSYPKIADYGEVEINPEEDHIRFACCDCGLVHDVAVSVSNKCKVGVAFKRFSRGTAQLRRHHFGGLQQRVVGKWRMVRVRT